MRSASCSHGSLLSSTGSLDCLDGDGAKNGDGASGPLNQKDVTWDGPAVARVSALLNTGPIRSLSATSSRSQATSEPDQTATDIDAPPLPDSPRRRPYRQYRCSCSTKQRFAGWPTDGGFVRH